MGARHIEKRQTRPTWKFWIKRDLNEEELNLESIKAASYYVRQKNYNVLPYGQLALIRSTVAYGFREGFRFRESNA